VPCAADEVGLLEYARVLLPSLLVIAGWFVVYSLQKQAALRQDTRKDLRARIDRLEGDLRGLNEKCIEYYTDSTKGFETSTQIKVLTDDIRRQSLILSKNFLVNIGGSKVNDGLINLMTAATGGKFESANRISLKSNDRQLSQLFQSTARLITLFEDGFFAAYPPVA